LYDVLGVRQDASQGEIKQAYKKLARQWHPDKNKSPRASEKFIEINKAYGILSKTRERFLYDHFGEATFFHRSQR
jgi:DnaJ-class molecular chaperone